MLIATRTRDRNLETLEKVLQKIQGTGFLVSPAKAQLVKRSVAYLGVEWLLKEDVLTDSELSSYADSLLTSDVTSLCSFLGLVGFSRDFIKGYSKIAQPLYLLLKKDQKCHLGQRPGKSICYPQAGTN